MTTVNERSRRESVLTALIWRLFEHPRWLRVVVYGSLPLAAFVLAALSGYPILDALRVAGLQAAIIGGSVLVAVGLRRLF
jgi:hypothetical protein